MIQINVCIAQRMDKVTCSQSGDLCHHLKQECVGGNIKGQTRVLTTATVMEVSKGNYDLAIALSLVLLVLSYAVVAFLTFAQNYGKQENR